MNCKQSLSAYWVDGHLYCAPFPSLLLYKSIGHTHTQALDQLRMREQTLFTIHSKRKRCSYRSFALSTYLLFRQLRLCLLNKQCLALVFKHEDFFLSFSTESVHIEIRIEQNTQYVNLNEQVLRIYLENRHKIKKQRK